MAHPQSLHHFRDGLNCQSLPTVNSTEKYTQLNNTEQLTSCPASVASYNTRPGNEADLVLAGSLIQPIRLSASMA